MIGLPPSSEGAVQRTIAACASACAVTPVGTPGDEADVGVTGDEAADAGPVPDWFAALTVNVYAWPAVSPPTVVLVAGGVPVIVFAVCAVEPMNGVMM